MLETKGQIENFEITQLLEAVYQVYGYDFREYARTTVKRRVKHRIKEEGLGTISELTNLIIHNDRVLNDFLFDLSITVTEMFRDPHFYKGYKEHVIPYLNTYPYINIWHAGCATGEEVYSMGIFLKEHGIRDRVLQYATDFNDHSLDIVKNGIYNMEDYQKWQSNYIQSGGKLSLSEYFTSSHSSLSVIDYLKENCVVANHNLVTDKKFADMQLIICKNVLIYFTIELQNQVFELFYDSLVPGGLLCLGRSESVAFTDFEDKFELLDNKAKIYQKKWK